MYSPKIEEDQVRKLYLLKVAFASIGVTKFMTEMVREALNKYIPEKVREIREQGVMILRPDELDVAKEEQ